MKKSILVTGAFGLLATLYPDGVEAAPITDPVAPGGIMPSNVSGSLPAEMVVRDTIITEAQASAEPSAVDIGASNIPIEGPAAGTAKKRRGGIRFNDAVQEIPIPARSTSAYDQSASAIQPDAVGGELQSNQTDSSSQVMEVDDQQSGMESEAPKESADGKMVGVIPNDPRLGRLLQEHVKDYVKNLCFSSANQSVAPSIDAALVAEARKLVLDNATLDKKEGHTAILWFVNKTAEGKEFHCLRDALTVEEAMGLYSRLHGCDPKLKEQWATRLVAEVPVFTDLVAVALDFPNLFLNDDWQPKKQPAESIPLRIRKLIDEIDSDAPKTVVTDHRSQARPACLLGLPEDFIEFLTVQVADRLPSNLGKMFPQFTRFADILCDRLDDDDPLFENPADLIELLRFGIQFNPNFVLRIKDPAKIKDYFPLLRELAPTEPKWYFTVGKLIEAKQFEHVRCLLQAPGFIRLLHNFGSRWNSPLFAAKHIVYPCIDNREHDLLTFVMQQPFFAQFINMELPKFGSLLSFAMVSKDLEMIKAVLSHGKLDLNSNKIEHVLGVIDADLISRLCAVEEKSMKMVQLLHLLKGAAIADGRIDIAFAFFNHDQDLDNTTESLSLFMKESLFENMVNNCLSKDGTKLLKFAFERKHIEMITMLLSHQEFDLSTMEIDRLFEAIDPDLIHLLLDVKEKSEEMNELLGYIEDGAEDQGLADVVACFERTSETGDICADHQIEAALRDSTETTLPDST